MRILTERGNSVTTTAEHLCYTALDYDTGLKSTAKYLLLPEKDFLFMLYNSGSTEKPRGMAHTTAEYLMWTSLTVKTVFNRYVGTAMTPSRTLAGSLATPASSADPSRTDVPPSCSSRCPRENPWRYWDMIQECARACACGLPPTATVDGLEIEAVGPLILLENFPDRFRSSLRLHFLDNVAALSNLVNGSSSVIQGDILIDATWSQIQLLLVFPWFDRRENSVGLSR